MLANLGIVIVPLLLFLNAFFFKELPKPGECDCYEGDFFSVNLLGVYDGLLCRLCLDNDFLLLYEASGE